MMHIGWTTTETLEDAERLARDAVRERIAACAQVDGPITSFFIWEDELKKTEEYRITFKFVSDRSEKISAWIRENHPYTTPEWLTSVCEDISPDYLLWARRVQGSTESSPARGENAISLSKKGTQLLRARKYHEAEEVLLAACEIDPENPYILVGLGDLYREQKKFDRAISYYEKLLRFEADNVFALRGIGDAHRGLNLHEEAIVYWKRYLECNPEDIQVMTRVGDSYKKLKNIKKSEKYYLKALEVDPDDRYALLGIGTLYYKSERDERALEYLERLLNIDDSYVAVLTMVGNIYRRRQDFDRAITAYMKAVQYEPGNTFALYGLGDCYRWQQNFPEVIRWWGKILEKEPKNQVMHSRVGDALLNIGDLDRAMEHYEKSLAIRFDPYALMGMSKIHRSRNEFDQAMDCCARILSELPEHERARAELAEVCRAMGEPERAEIIMRELKQG